MDLVREVQPDDLNAILALAQERSFGLTTLQPDPDHIAARIQASQRGEAPLFVLVELEPASAPQRGPIERTLIGTTGLFTRTGGEQPFFAYRLERTIHSSAALGVRNEGEALHLVREHDGPSEMGTLFLHPAARGRRLGRLLSLARLLYIANEPQRFDREVIAELRGVVDDRGRSPFWDALGRHFFRVDYPVADNLSGRDKSFIAELMPQHPIYLPLLPEPARAVIGKVHPHTAPAMRVLQDEGFYPSRMVDIFDAGPIIRCDRDALRTLRESRILDITISEPGGPCPSPNRRRLVATTAGPFRCCLEAVHQIAAPTLSRLVADALGVGPGSRVRVVAEKPQPDSESCRPCPS